MRVGNVPAITKGRTLQTTIQQSVSHKGVSGLILRSIVQQKLRCTEGDLQFMLASVFEATSTTFKSGYKVTYP
jgi:hypothetical protein